MNGEATMEQENFQIRQFLNICVAMYRRKVALTDAKIQVISKLNEKYDTHNQMLQEKEYVKLWEQALPYS